MWGQPNRAASSASSMVEAWRFSATIKPAKSSGFSRRGATRGSGAAAMQQMFELCFRRRRCSEPGEIKIRLSTKVARMPTFTKSVNLGHPPMT